MNGPAVMDLSHHVAPDTEGGLELSLNLLAFFQEEFDQLLAQKRTSFMPPRVFLGAFFSPKVITTLLRNANLARMSR